VGGNRGGLNSPQAVGLVTLYYDHDHLMTKAQRPAQVWPNPNDTLQAWDSDNRLKQPYLLRYENGNLPVTKIQQYLNPDVQRRTGIFVGSADSTRMAAQLRPYIHPDTWNYWRGRTKSSANLSWYQPVVRFYGFYPYILLPSQSMRFAFAEVVGYGPGVAGDRIYSDLGGSTRTGVDAGSYFNPVPSWYDTLQYPFLGPRPYIGSTYLQTHPLPWYVTPGVVSIRDVADRAIQMYTGRSLAKHDTLQYEPMGSTLDGRGVYNANHRIPIPAPSPLITVQNSRSGFNRISWKPAVEGFSDRVPGLSGPLSHYLVMRSPSLLGPWAVMDSVPRRDPTFFRDSLYIVVDTTSLLGSYYYYSVVSVDSSGLRSGITPNLTEHVTQAPAVKTLGKVYAVPNPLIVTNNEPNPDASDPTGDVSDRVYFYGLTKHCTIRVFSYSGQLIETIYHGQEGQGGEGQILHPFFQVSRNNQIIASGVYYFVVEDASGAKAHGKFVIIH
jgi:hypothetical protein